MTNRLRIDEGVDTLKLRKPSIASSDDETVEIRSLTPQQLEQLLQAEHQG